MAAAKATPDLSYEQRRDRTLARRLLLILADRGAINDRELAQLERPTEAMIARAEALYD